MLPGFQLKLVWPVGMGSSSLYLALKPKLARWSLEGVAGLEETTTAGSMEPPPVTLPTCETGVRATPFENSEVSLTALPSVPAGSAVTVAVANMRLAGAMAELKLAVKLALPKASVVTDFEPRK